MAEAYVSIAPRLPLDRLIGDLGSVPPTAPVAFSDRRTHRRASLGPEWSTRIAELDQGASYVEWANDFLIHLDDVSVSSWTCSDLSFRVFLRDLTSITFETGVGGSILPWWRVYDEKPRRFQFGDGHVQLGVAAAFRGEGHTNHLVSRRWLEFGPWALLRLENHDLTFCVFYDPDLTDAPEDIALAVDQAYPGHERMGISPVGGYLFGDHDYEGPIEGTYLTESRRFVRVVHGRDLSQREMLDAAAFRRDSRDTDTPIERFSYVFMEEEVAREHLHELWLRELECFAIIAGREVRLDEDYRPDRSPPDWAVAVEAKWQPILEELGSQ